MVGSATPWEPRVEAFLEAHSVGRLATVDEGGQPYVTPVCYAVALGRIFSAVDEKPKRASGRELKRLRNIRGNPQVCLTVDTYSDDWARLGFVMVRGEAEVVTSGPEHEAAIPLLRARYRQYREMEFRGRAVVVIRPRRVVAWGRV